jgi:hypothetical protein
MTVVAKSRSLTMWRCQARFGAHFRLHSMEERHFRFLSWPVRSYLRVGESLAKEAQARTLLHQVKF